MKYYPHSAHSRILLGSGYASPCLQGSGRGSGIELYCYPSLKSFLYIFCNIAATEEGYQQRRMDEREVEEKRGCMKIHITCDMQHSTYFPKTTDHSSDETS